MMIWFLIAATQNIIESLPLSSSGNALLLVCYLEKHGFCGARELLSTSNDFFQIVTVAVLLIYLYPWWLTALKSLRRKPFVAGKALLFIGIADVITVGWYVFFSLITTDAFPLYAGFLITSFILALCFFVDTSESYTPCKWYHAIVLGMVQGCALLPGISRLGSTYCAGRILNLSPRTALAFSLALSGPLSLAAFVRWVCGGVHNFVPSYAVILPFFFLCGVISYLLLRVTTYAAKKAVFWYFSPIPLLTAFLAWYYCLTR